MWQYRLRCTAAAHRAHVNHHPCLTRKKESWTNVSITTRIWVALPSSTCTCHMPPKAWKITVTSIKRCPSAHHSGWFFFALLFIQTHTKKGSSKPPIVQQCLALQWLPHAACCCTQGRAKQEGFLVWLSIDTSSFLCVQHKLPPSRQPAKGALPYLSGVSTWNQWHW